MTLLRITFLGTSSAVPTLKRGLASISILRGNELLLFDVGEGVQRAMMSVGLGFNRRTKIFITHMHGDHSLGLIGLIQTMSMVNRQAPVYLYGPKGIKGFVLDNIRYLGFGLTFPLYIKTVTEGKIVNEKEYVIEAIKANHSILSYSYCLREKKRAGRFYPERAKELGVPKGRLWSLLKSGKEVKVGDKIVKPSYVLGPEREGRVIGISGDTRPDEKFVEFFKGCDVLIFDSTYCEEHKDKAIENMHSTAKEAAEIAKKANAKLLILTHFSARYDDVNKLIEEAAKVHNSVIAANDFLTIEVPYPNEGDFKIAYAV
jgi:ribonuclease Z